MEQQDLTAAPHPVWVSVHRILIGVALGLALIGAAYAVGRWA